MTLKVGDIVVCHDYKPIDGKKGFVEEIITDPHTSWNKLRESGCYSIYGFEKAHFSTGDSHYYGDCIGNTLSSTGESMTVEALEKFKQNEPSNKGLALDMEIVKRNLSRTSGRNNPGRSTVLEELKK